VEGQARQLRQKGITASDIAKMLGVSRATVYRYLSDGVPISA
jgi:predicted transcriptional regulator